MIIEEFDGNPASDLSGMSVSTDHARLGPWQQTWVDNSGGYLDFRGGMQPDGRMILGREVERDGKVTQQRMVISNITADSLDCSWERSTDSGRSWRPLWLLHYTRRP